jgi:hypothetical protein
MYHSFIHPLLEYADVVWDNLTDKLNKEIESFQNVAARIVAGATKLCNIKTLISELGMESLEHRRNKHINLIAINESTYITFMSFKSSNSHPTKNI